MHRAALVSPILAALTFLACQSAAQQPPVGHEPPPSARKLAEDGYGLFKAGKYVDAISALRQAHAQFQAPQYLLYMARAYSGLGKLVEAHEQYSSAASMKAPPGAPPEFVQKFDKATALASEELASLTKIIPTVMLLVGGPGDTEVRVTSAEGPLRVTATQNVIRVEMNAGERSLQVTATGFESAEVRVKAKERTLGEPIETLSVTLARVAAPPLVVPPTPHQPSPGSSRTGASAPGSARPVEQGTDPVAPNPLSHRLQPGGYARGDVQVIDGGIVAVLGVSFGAHDFIEPYVGVILGRNVGLEPGLAGYFLRGALKPRLDLAAPIFFEDTAYGGVRLSGGLQWDPNRHFGAFVQVGGAYFPVVPGGYEQLVFLPSFGVQGRI